MNRPLVFHLPTGERASVGPGEARALADALWELGAVPGALMAAVRILQALRSLRGNDVKFEEREVPAVTQVLANRITWGVRRQGHRTGTLTSSETMREVLGGEEA